MGFEIFTNRRYRPWKDSQKRIPTVISFQFRRVTWNVSPLFLSLIYVQYFIHLLIQKKNSVRTCPYKLIQYTMFFFFLFCFVSLETFINLFIQCCQCVYYKYLIKKKSSCLCVWLQGWQVSTVYKSIWGVLET